MPIYAYQCSACGYAKDVLQKMSDAPLTECPVCGKAAFSKQVTAAGFQLKGNGWYATDFKNSGSAPASAKSASNDGNGANGNSGNTGNTDNAGSKTADGGSVAPAAATATAATSSGGCGGNCACH